jgi:hypothetical protein
MTQLTLKNRIEDSQMSILLHLLKSWNIDAEITFSQTQAKSKESILFEKTFGMWANRDIDVKKMRLEAYERRTKYYDNATL